MGEEDVLHSRKRTTCVQGRGRPAFEEEDVLRLRKRKSCVRGGGRPAFEEEDVLKDGCRGRGWKGGLGGGRRARARGRNLRSKQGREVRRLGGPRPGCMTDEGRGDWISLDASCEGGRAWPGESNERFDKYEWTGM